MADSTKHGFAGRFRSETEVGRNLASLIRGQEVVGSSWRRS